MNHEKLVYTGSMKFCFKKKISMSMLNRRFVVQTNNQLIFFSFQTNVILINVLRLYRDIL